MLRVWAAPGHPQQVCLRTTWRAPAAWGLLPWWTLLAMQPRLPREEHDPAAVVTEIREAFDAEWSHPTDSPTELSGLRIDARFPPTPLASRGIDIGRMELTLRCTMRGTDTKQASMLCLISPETRVPAKHPIRRDQDAGRRGAGEAVADVRRDVHADGTASIPPERLLKAMLLMALYTVRSERLFCEQLDYNLLFRWFLDMDMVEPSFDPTVFTKNRDGLMDHDVAGEFFRAVVEQARTAKLMSSEHFTVDGTLIEAWASLKSFKKKDDDDTTPPDDPGNPTVDFHGEKRSNETHESTTDPRRSWRARARARRRSCRTPRTR